MWLAQQPLNIHILLSTKYNLWKIIMNIDEIQDEWEKDSYIDDNFLGETATKAPKLHAKYLKLLVGVKLKHTKLSSDYNILRKNKFRYYRGELSREELIEGFTETMG